MRLARQTLLACVFCLVLAEMAHATTISTPPGIPDDDGTFFCLVTNVSDRILTVMIDVVGVNGSTSGHFGFVVPPLQTRAAPGHGTLGDRLCQITVDGSKSTIRASVEVFSSSATIEAVYPVP
jgi:hypothetical protein